MKYELTKLSAPGWSKTYSTEEQVFDELFDWICDDCLIEYVDEHNFLPVEYEDLLWTACGAEFMVEVHEV